MPEHIYRGANRFRKRGDILVLALNGIGFRVAAGTMSAPVEAEDREMLRQTRENRRPARVVRACPVYQHQWRTASDLVKSNRGSIAG